MYRAWEMYAYILKHQNTAPLQETIVSSLCSTCPYQNVNHVLTSTRTYQHILVYTSMYQMVCSHLGVLDSKCSSSSSMHDLHQFYSTAIWILSTYYIVLTVLYTVW